MYIKMSAYGQFIVARPIHDVIDTLQDQHPVKKSRWVIGGRVTATYTPKTYFVDATSFETSVRLRQVAIGLGFKIRWSSFSFKGDLETISPDVTRIYFETKFNEFNLIWTVIIGIVIATFFGITSQSLICPAFILIFIGMGVVISKYQTPYVYKTHIVYFLSEVFEEESAISKQKRYYQGK